MYFSFLLPLNGQKIFHANDNYPANIRLDEDVLKTSFVFVFKRRLDENEYILINHSLQKTSWPRPIYSSCPYVYKMFSRRLQDVLPKRLQDIFKTPSRRLRNVFKKSRKYVLKTSSRRFEDVSSSYTVFAKKSLRSIQHVCKTYRKDRCLQKDSPRSHF